MLLAGDHGHSLFSSVFRLLLMTFTGFPQSLARSQGTLVGSNAIEATDVTILF
jgi:hypothetical protein